MQGNMERGRERDMEERGRGREIERKGDRHRDG